LSANGRQQPMSGGISPDDSTVDGRYGSKKGKKGNQDKSFEFLVPFALFVSTGFHH
jgi:hypothetical protein